jgi:hypothetical protein
MAEGGHVNDPKQDWHPDSAFDPRDPAFRQLFWEQVAGPEHPGMAGMNNHEEQELLLHYGPRKERKALKKRMKAEKRAKKPTDKLD